MNLLLDSALKATVILFAAWAASLALRRASADVRHTVWLAAILAVALLPAALLMPQGSIPAAIKLTVPAAVSTVAAGSRRLPWLLMVWAAGASLVMIRWVFGIAAAARITTDARQDDGVLYSDRAQTPMTWGFLRPVVILPAYAQQWTEAERELVIRHEGAHILRRDWLWQTLASLTTAVFWFHPLMWLANVRLRREAEAATDDLVLSGGAAPADYASRLVDVARHLHRSHALVATIPMVRKPELETRVRSILDASRRRASAGIVARCAIVMAALALVAPLSLVHAQGNVYKVGNGVTQPSIIHKEDPAYTEETKTEGIQGTVVLTGEVTAEGVARNLSVKKSLHPDLDANAIAAVSNWKFKPGMKDGQPVSVYVTIEVIFRLL